MKLNEYVLLSSCSVISNQNFTYDIGRNHHHKSVKDNNPHLSQQRIIKDKLTKQTCSKPKDSRLSDFTPCFTMARKKNLAINHDKVFVLLHYL